MLGQTGALALAAGVAPRALWAQTEGEVAAPKKQPNILFILSDDHRWDAMSCVGHPFIQTPNLDRLAATGVRFSNAFVTTSLCSPSRASFLTGQYASRHGVQNNITPWDNANVTFLELLHGAGYGTAFIGKWHMPGDVPQLRGVDEFVTFTVQGGQGRYFDCPLIVNGKEEPSRKEYITEELTDRTIEFMRARHAEDRPFAVALAHKAAHHQFLPPPEFKGIYKDVKLNLPEEADSWATLANGHMYYGTLLPLSVHYRMYCETLTAMDHEIGRALDALEEMGIAEETIVVYAGDNGYFWGEHRLVDKRWAYEESIRVPMMIRAPGIAAGAVREQMALNVDVAPTLLELAGLEVPSGVQGASWVPMLQNAGAPWRDAWYYEYFRDYPYRVPSIEAVRTDTQIYIDYGGAQDAELYDLAADPRQHIDLMDAKKEPPLAAEMRERLRKVRREVRGG